MSVIYYAAMSVDGFIATATGGVEWLETLPPVDDGYGYDSFYGGVDALVMGRATYEQIQDFGEWPYAGKPAWVLSRGLLPAMHPDVILSQASVQEVMAEIRARGLGVTWLVGGGQLARAFLDAGLVTELYVTITPHLLGAGIPLLAPGATQVTALRLLDSRVYDVGVVQLRYAVASSGES